MLEVIRATGAPVDQGRIQGEAAAGAIRGELARMRAGRTLLTRAWERRRARRSTAIALGRHLPGQHERIEGIALGARVRVADLVWVESVIRTRGIAIVSESGLAASIDVPPALASMLLLRRSTPDAGGFPSAELTLAPLAGCLAGVNAEGLAVICVEDGSLREPSLRFLAHEVVFRSREFDAAVELVRRRGLNLGGTGKLVVADAKGRVQWLRLRFGDVQREEPPPACAELQPLPIHLDPAAGRVVFRDARAIEHELFAAG